MIGSMATQNAGTSLPNSSRACCCCNRNGRCQNCACCKGHRHCVSSLPGRLGRCENYGTSSANDSEELIVQQNPIYSAAVLGFQFAAKRLAIATHNQFLTDMHDSLLISLPPKLQLSILLSCEKGSSSWLTAQPLVDQGFALHKGAFRDALCLRYGWQPQLLPFHCICGKTTSVEHELSCPFGGFPSI